jgi:hypothetical protein
MTAHRHPHGTTSEQRERAKIAYLSAKTEADERVANFASALDALCDSGRSELPESPKEWLSREGRAAESLARALVALTRAWITAHVYADISHP